MTPYRMRVLFRDVLGRLAVCLMMMVSATGQEQRTPDQEIQFQAMKKFEFLVGKWSGQALWFTNQGLFDLTAAQDVHYEQHGLILKIRSQELRPEGKPALGGVLLISYDVKSRSYRLRGDVNHLDGILTIDDDWRGMSIQFKMPNRTTLEMLRVNEKQEWAEVHWVTEGTDPPWMFLQAVFRRQKAVPAPK